MLPVCIDFYLKYFTAKIVEFSCSFVDRCENDVSLYKACTSRLHGSKKGCIPALKGALRCMMKTKSNDKDEYMGLIIKINLNDIDENAGSRVRHLAEEMVREMQNNNLDTSTVDETTEPTVSDADEPNSRVKRGLGACIKRCLGRMLKSKRKLHFKRCKMMCF